MKTADLYQEALKYLEDKNIPSLTDKGYIARWMTDFAIQCAQVKYTIPVITAEELKRFKMHQDYVPVKGASLYVFTIDQINEFVASQFKSEPLPEISDEEIKSIVDEYLLTMAEEIAFTAGMKQYRSELRKRAEQKKDMPEGYSFEIGV